MNKFLVLTLGLLMALVFPIMALADDDDSHAKNAKGSGIEQAEVHEQDADQEDVEEKDIDEDKDKEAVDEEVYEEENETPPAWVIQKNLIEQEKDNIESLKDQLEENKEALKEQYEAAEEKGDLALMESLAAQIKDINAQIAAYKVEMKQKIELMHQVMREKYSAGELDQLSLVKQSLSGLPDIEKVLPVENVLVPGGNIKFDTPPVIKSGRTLIPARAVSEAMGATVTWNEETQTVTIVKGDKTIILNLAENTVLVNTVVTAIDVPAEIMNNRTMVPLRFIAENLGLKVQWEPETETIEID